MGKEMWEGGWLTPSAVTEWKNVRVVWLLIGDGTGTVKSPVVNCYFEKHAKQFLLSSITLYISKFIFLSIPATIYSSVRPFCYILQPKGRAVSRLLESFAADEGFQMDGSSFSEEEEDSNHSCNNKSPGGKRQHWISWHSFKQQTVSVMLKY